MRIYPGSGKRKWSTVCVAGFGREEVGVVPEGVSEFFVFREDAIYSKTAVV